MEKISNQFYIAERIANISELEKLLEHERLLIEMLVQETQKEHPDMIRFKNVVKKVSELHNQACSFEFLLERRRIRKKVHIF